jgi:tRNA-dihydrouridine synthase
LPPPSLDRQWQHIVRHCRWKVENQGDELRAIQTMRARLMAYSRGMPDAKRLRERFAHVSSLIELETIACDNIAGAQKGVVAECIANSCEL